VLLLLLFFVSVFLNFAPVPARLCIHFIIVVLSAVLRARVRLALTFVLAARAVAADK
jgi:hypothetical protein